MAKKSDVLIVAALKLPEKNKIRYTSFPEVHSLQANARHD